MRLAARLLLGIMATLMMASGCTEAPGVGAPQPDTSEPATAPPAAGSAAGLAAKKKAAGIADCPASDATIPPVPQGLPDVVLPCLGGGRGVRLAGLRGRPMMINVWAQWCGPCRQEAPLIAEIAADEGDLLVLGIDYSDPLPDKAIEFARLSAWTYPQLVDDDKVLAAPLAILGPPQTYFVTSEGKIAYRQSGPFGSADQIRRLAKTHLGVSL